jgi:protoporphyrinogen oxidase
MKHFVLVGSGIAGLYLGYKLVKKGYDVTIIEKEKSLGGRMFSEKVETKDQVYFLEAGAGVIRSDEKHIQKLLKELKIPISFWTGKTDIIYHEKNKTEPLNYNYTELLENICQNASNDKTFLDAIDESDLSMKEKIGVMIGTSYSELFRANGKYICEDNDFTEFLINDHDYKFGKPKSWNELVERLEKEILSMGGVIYHEEPVVEIKSDSVITKTKVISYDELVITCPYHQFKKIKVNNQFDAWKDFMNKYHHETNYLRIYSYFEEDIEIPNKIATNLSIRRVIPISKRILMSVYTDGTDATYIHQLNEKELNRLIRKELKILLGRKIPKIEKNWKFYWYKGISNWEPMDMSVDEIVKKIRNPLPSIYFCGDTYSLYPGWIHGALQSCDFILNKF